MPKHLIKSFLSNSKVLNKYKNTRVISYFLKNPNLLYLNRKSVSGSIALGLFWSVIPIPVQMIASSICTVAIRVNVPIAICLVWISNPLTMAPIFYFNYIVGVWIIDEPIKSKSFEPNIDWIMSQLELIWMPLYLGSFVVGIFLAFFGYLSVRLYWRWYVINKYRKRFKKIT